MTKAPSINDLFLSVMASFIGFGLVVGIAQAAFNYGGAQILFTANPVFAQVPSTTDTGSPAGVSSCPSGQVLHTSANYAAGTGYCDCPEGYIFQYPNNIGLDRGNCFSKSPVPVAARATTTINKKYLDTQCIATAVEARDSSIITGLTAYNTAAQAALGARKSALVNAWQQFSDRKVRRTEIKSIWETYRSAVRSAVKTFSVAKRAAWAKFYADRKSCGIYATSDDYTNQGVDNSL